MAGVEFCQRSILQCNDPYREKKGSVLDGTSAWSFTFHFCDSRLAQQIGSAALDVGLTLTAPQGGANCEYRCYTMRKSVRPMASFEAVGRTTSPGGSLPDF